MATLLKTCRERTRVDFEKIKGKRVSKSCGELVDFFGGEAGQHN
jgi:hypothetical protein